MALAFPRAMKTTVLAISTCLLFACASTQIEERPFFVAEGSSEASALLAFLNSVSATYEVLDEDVPLDRRAAANLVEHVNGADGVYGTADDELFGTVAEVDQVPHIGPKS